MEFEVAVMVPYTHYSMTVFGQKHIPIVSWIREKARESLLHAHQADWDFSTLGGHASLKIPALVETHKHSTNDILEESLEHESE